MDKYVEESFASWNWHTKKEHEQWLLEQKKKRDSAISPSFKEFHDKIIEMSKKERNHTIKLFKNEFKFVHLATVTSLKYSKTRNSFFARVTISSSSSSKGPGETEECRELEVPTTWVEGAFKQELVELIKNHWRRGYVQVPTVDSGVIKIVDMPVARIKYFPEHIQMGKDVKAVATLEKELKRTREKFPKSRLVKEIERDTGLI